MMKLTFLGTRGGLRIANGSLSGIVLYDDTKPILIDAGSDAVLKHIDPITDLEHILLTHTHRDHMYKLRTILHTMGTYTQKTKPHQLSLYSPKSWYLHWVARKKKKYPQFHTTVSHEIPQQIGNITVDYFETYHKRRNYAYTFTKNNYTIAITGDTSYSDALAEFVANVDILVCEATFSEKSRLRAQLWGHMTPLQVAQLANKAQPKLLVLTHFYKMPRERFLAEVKKHYKGNVIVAVEGMHIENGVVQYTHALG